MTHVAAPLHVQVVVVTVRSLTVLRLFASRKTQFGTASVVAVGRVTATATEPTYSMRLGPQSVVAMVSVAVVPVMARPTTPGRASTGAVASPPEGMET